MAEWCQGQPLIHVVKQLRNDGYLAAYTRRAPDRADLLGTVLNGPLPGGNLLIAIAFERPETVRLLIENTGRFIDDAALVIADNSRSSQGREQIKAICDQTSTRYVPLPRNRTRHANRSHGMAMQWCYENMVKAIEPDIFGFVDHDLIPMKRVRVTDLMRGQDLYGVRWKSDRFDAWQLWAGHCFFRFAAVARYPLNFLYDFPLGLDTGGRNYRALYRRYDPGQLTFASNFLVDLHQKSDRREAHLQIIDDRWIHLRGAGHRAGFDARYRYFHGQMEALDAIPGWSVDKPESFAQIIETRP